MTKHHFYHADEPADMAAFLGLSKPTTYTGIMLADAIKDGVPMHSVERVCKAIDPGGSRFGVRNIMARATYHRRVKDAQPLSRDDSERVWNVARVYIEANRLYRSDDDARAFMFRPHPLLDQRRPIDLASESAVGAELVLDALNAADAGVAI
jgi:putative toxin-antitoxin system antitoxin component (TIGR02293 family)